MEQVRKLLAVTDDSQRAVRDSCRKHLTTIFTNIINNPAELKYRKIREQNQILSQELFGFENATDILEIAGFDRTGAKSANGASWVFMATPEDSEAMSVLQGILDVLIDEKNKIQDDIKVQVLSEDDDHSSSNISRNQSEENNHDSNTNMTNTTNSNNTNVNREEIPPELLAAARQAFGQPQQQQQSQPQPQPQPEINSNNNQPQIAPKFFSFARSVGFQMRLEALQAAQERQKEYQQHQDAAENNDNNDDNNNNSSTPLQSFLVEQLLDTRNSDVISETLRIIRVLIDNMRKDPAEAKYRLLKFDNQMLSKYFFPVSGAPELFIGLLGFSLSDEGLAKKIDNAQDGDGETKAFEKVGEVLKKVEEGLQLRREIENQERRRLAKELMKDDIEEERRRQGLHSGSSKKQQQGNNDDDAAQQQQKPKKKIPISEVLNYLLGKPTEVDED